MCAHHAPLIEATSASNTPDAPSESNVSRSPILSLADPGARRHDPENEHRSNERVFWPGPQRHFVESSTEYILTYPK